MNRCFSWCWKSPWLHPDQSEFRDFLQWSSWHFQFVRCRASQLPIPWPPPITLRLVRDDLVVMPVIPSMLLLSQCYFSGVECVLTTIDPLFSKFCAERELFWKPPWQPPVPNTRSEIPLLIEFVHLTTGVCDTLHMVTEFPKQYFVGLLVLITREFFMSGRIVFAQGELKFSVESSHHTMQFSSECQGHLVLILLDSSSSRSFVRTSMADKLSGVSQFLTHVLVHVIDGGIVAYNQKFNPTTLALQPPTCPFCRATITRLRVANSGTNHAATSNSFKGQTSAIRSLSLSRIGHGFSVGAYKDINKDGKPYIQVKMKDGQNKISAMKDTVAAYLDALILTIVATSSASTTGIGVSDPYGWADTKGCSLKQQHADWMSSFRVHVIISQFLNVAASETRNGVCAAHNYLSDSLDQQDGIGWPFGRHDEMVWLRIVVVSYNKLVEVQCGNTSLRLMPWPSFTIMSVGTAIWYCDTFWTPLSPPIDQEEKHQRPCGAPNGPVHDTHDQDSMSVVLLSGNLILILPWVIWVAHDLGGTCQMDTNGTLQRLRNLSTPTARTDLQRQASRNCVSTQNMTHYLNRCCNTNLKRNVQEAKLWYLVFNRLGGKPKLKKGGMLGTRAGCVR
jgi:hypothetical protein